MPFVILKKLWCWDQTKGLTGEASKSEGTVKKPRWLLRGWMAGGSFYSVDRRENSQMHLEESRAERESRLTMATSQVCWGAGVGGDMTIKRNWKE